MEINGNKVESHSFYKSAVNPVSEWMLDYNNQVGSVK